MRGVVHMQGRVLIHQAGRNPILIPNLVVDTGLIRFATLLATGAGTLPAAIAIGDDNTIPLAANTELAGSEIDRTAVATTQEDNTVSYSCTFVNLGSSYTIREMGLFDTVAFGGTMIARVVVPDIIVSNSGQVDVDWQLLFAGIGS